MLSKAWSGFIDARTCEKSPTPAWLCRLALLGKDTQNITAAQYLHRRESSLGASCPPSETWTAQERGTARGKISANIQGNSPLKPEPPAISTAFFSSASCGPTASHCPAFSQHKQYPHFLSSNLIIALKRLLIQCLSYLRLLTLHMNACNHDYISCVSTC